MKIKDIVKMTAELLELTDVLSLNAFTGETNEEDALVKHDLDLLVRCANLSLSILATDKFKLKKVETFLTETGEISFDNFSKNVFEILSVKSKNKKVDFRVYPTILDCFNKGNYSVTYAYMPDYKTLDEDIDDFDKKVPLHLMAYFTASEFSFVSGNFEDASIWEQKYKEALGFITSSKSRKLPERRWY